MGIDVVKSDDRSWVIRLGERFDFGCVEEFRRSYESIPTEKHMAVNIDFKATKYIDSSALGMLINAKSHLQGDSDNRMTLSNCNSQIRKIFSISKFELKFNIAGSE